MTTPFELTGAPSSSINAHLDTVADGKFDAATISPTAGVGTSSSQTQLSATDVATDTSAAARRRGGGRRKDMIWDSTTILADKTVMCNLCHAMIHRYGCSKVERVRAHFQNRCQAAPAGLVITNGTSLISPGANNASSNSKPTKKRKTAHSDTITTTPTSLTTTAQTAALQPSPTTTSAPVIATTTAITVATVTLADAKARRRADHAAKVALFKRKFAAWVFATAQPLDTGEHALLVDATRLLRPDCPLPTQRELVDVMLPLEATASHACVDAALQGRACCLAIEHWRDADGAQHIAYSVALNASQSFLLATTTSSLDTTAAFSSTRPPAVFELRADEVERVLDQHPLALFFAVVTPETRALSAATQAHVTQAFPQCRFFYGCARHALQLLQSDVRLMLPWLDAALVSVHELLAAVRTSPALRRQLPTLQRFVESSDIVEAIDCALVDAVAAAESALAAIVSRRDFVDAPDTTATPATRALRQRVQDFVLGERFASDLALATRVLAPLEQQLERLASCHAMLSYAYRGFLDLRNAFATLDGVSKKDRALLASCVTDRLAAIDSDAHRVAYVLDPVMRGAGMDHAALQQAEQFIATYSSDFAPSVVRDELLRFRALVQQLPTSQPLAWQQLVRGDVSAFAFWSNWSHECPALQQLGYAVFSLPATIATPIALTHTTFQAQCEKLHVRYRTTPLTPEALQQLVHVYCNAQQ